MNEIKFNENEINELKTFLFLAKKGKFKSITDKIISVEKTLKEIEKYIGNMDR